ncbi:MAG: class I SAM-dependent methyltransferase [Thermomonas sp.]|uniref:class I SAM-dependent methyltransferase n=1 Tax=Thermomonas sp. TaxID=1971895 RepID=UPI0039E59FA6
MEVRKIARKIPFLYKAVGFFRYWQHQKQLVRANAAYVRGSKFPPPALRYRVHRAFDLTSYQQVGQAIANDIAVALERNGLTLDGKKVLDLGSGPGRVAFWLKQRFPSCMLHCSDIDAEAIGWASENLQEVASFHLNDAEPPTDFPDAGFDFVYCISLFTHLDAEMQDKWLQELRRIVKPGGFVLATTHGRFAMDSCTKEEVAEIERNGIHFRVDRSGALKLDGLPDFYQTTFHSKQYVERHWGKFFELVSHSEGGLGRHQDMILMRRK